MHHIIRTIQFIIVIFNLLMKYNLLCLYVCLWTDFVSVSTSTVPGLDTKLDRMKDRVVMWYDLTGYISSSCDGHYVSLFISVPMFTGQIRHTASVSEGMLH